MGQESVINREVPSFQGCPYFGGVLISGPYRGVFILGGVLTGSSTAEDKFISSTQGPEYVVVSIFPWQRSWSLLTRIERDVGGPSCDILFFNMRPTCVPNNAHLMGGILGGLKGAILPPES